MVFDAHVITPHRSGIGEFNWHLLRGILRCCADRVDLHLYVPSGIVSVETEEDIVRYTRDVHDGDIYRLHHQWQLPRLLRSERYDLFHSPDFMFPFLCPIPVVSTIYDLIPLVHPEYLAKSLKVRLLSVYRFLMRTAVRKSARIITISECSRGDIVRMLGADPSKVDIVYAAHTLGQGDFSPGSTAPDSRSLIGKDAEAQEHTQPQEHTAHPESMDLPDARLRAGRFLLYVGRHDPYKGLGLLLHALARAVRNGLPDDILLAVAGKRDPRYPFDETAGELGLQNRVLFLDYVGREELSALYAHALALVFPSLYEGFGLPLLDAMAHGTPVVCSDRASLPEVGGDAVCYVDPEDEDAFARTLRAIAESPLLRQELASKGDRHFRRFSWNQTAEKTVDSYTRAIINQ